MKSPFKNQRVRISYAAESGLANKTGTIASENHKFYHVILDQTMEEVQVHKIFINFI